MGNAYRSPVGRIPVRHLAADHEPPHVHVFKGDGEAKVLLGSKGELPSFVTIEGMTRAEARKAWKMSVEHQKALLQAWERIHGNTDHQ